MTVEADLLAAIASGDEASREVYRDWLEAAEQHERAEFLRIGRADDPAAVARLRELAMSPSIDPAWRRTVARLPITGCVTEGCPHDWGALSATADADVRRCSTCVRDIRYAYTTADIDDLARRGSRYARDVLAAPTWLQSTAWQEGNYTALVGELYPEAGGPVPIEVHSSLPGYVTLFREHALVRLFFGWSISGTDRFQSWSGLFAMGPLGFARIAQRPSVVRDLLIAESFALPRPGETGYGIQRTVDDLAMLLGEALCDDVGPDEWRDDRMLYQRSGMLSANDLASINSGRPQFVMDDASWRELRPRLPDPTGTPTATSYDVAFSSARAIGGGQVRFERVDVSIVRADHALRVRREVVGTVACTAPMQPVIGRPFVVDGQARRAGLLQRGDWS